MAVAFLVALALATSGLHRLARSRTFQVFGTLVPRVETSRRDVALTFDDGPTPEAIDEILRLLAVRGVRATFFVNGAPLAEAPGLGARLVAAGHELGNHTYSHARMVLKPPSAIRDEVERTDALIRAAGEHGEIFFRPPYGWKLVGLPWYLARTGRTTVTWDVEPDSPPWGGDAARVADACVRGVRPGSIVLLHVWWQAPSRAALPVIIDRLKADGYAFLTVGELLRSRS
ncbi:MAG: polysaccharide deacetylase family protein [Vicinamibacteria bacterium]